MSNSSRELRVSRREVLGSLALAPLVGCAAARSRESATPDCDVVIVGAGLAGLALAYELERADLRVRVLEASHRLGGRILTLRHGLKTGLRAEAGAERVPVIHTRTRQWLQRLNIATAPYRAGPMPALKFHGRWYPFQSFRDLPHEVLRGLSPSEWEAAPLDLALRYVREAAEPEPEDPRTGWEWLRDEGLSERAQALVQAFCFLPLERMSAVSFHRAVIRDWETWDAELIAGGTDRLIRSLQAGLRRPVEEGFKVRAVEVRDQRALIRGEGDSVIQSRWCVLCLPLRPLQRIEFSGGVSRQLSQLWRNWGMAQESKVHWSLPLSRMKTVPVYSYRMAFPRVAWWLPEEAQGQAILTAFAAGSEVESVGRICRGTHREWQQYVNANLPEIGPDPVRAITHDFSIDPLTGGAYPYPRRGVAREQDVWHDGPLVVAGADLSSWPGWMEGAIRSAEAARDVIVGNNRTGDFFVMHRAFSASRERPGFDAPKRVLSFEPRFVPPGRVLQSVEETADSAATKIVQLPVGRNRISFRVEKSQLRA